MCPVFCILMPTLKNRSYLILRSTGTCIQINPSKSIILIFLLPYARPSVQSIAQLKGEKKKNQTERRCSNIKGKQLFERRAFLLVAVSAADSTLELKEKVTLVSKEVCLYPYPDGNLQHTTSSSKMFPSHLALNPTNRWFRPFLCLEGLDHGLVPSLHTEHCFLQSTRSLCTTHHCKSALY